MAKSVREWQEEFIKLFTECRKELGVNDLRITVVRKTRHFQCFVVAGGKRKSL